MNDKQCKIPQSQHISLIIESGTKSISLSHTPKYAKCICFKMGGYKNQFKKYKMSELGYEYWEKKLNQFDQHIFK